MSGLIADSRTMVDKGRVEAQVIVSNCSTLTQFTQLALLVCL